MIYIRKFLCYDNTKSGSAFCAGYYIIISVLFISICIFGLLNKEEIVKKYNDEAIELNKNENSNIQEVEKLMIQHIFALGLINCSLALLVNILLGYGVQTDGRALFIPWIFWMCSECFQSLVVSLSCFYFMAVAEKLIVTFVIILVSAVSGLALKLYMLLCILSQYQVLGDQQQSVVVQPPAPVVSGYQPTVIAMQPYTSESKLSAV